MIDGNAVLAGFAGGFAAYAVVEMAKTAMRAATPLLTQWFATELSRVASSPAAPTSALRLPEPGSVWTFEMEGYTYYAYVFQIEERKGFTLVHYAVRREDDLNVPTRACSALSVERFVKTYNPPPSSPAPSAPPSDAASEAT
jgi:hypothetical protein